VGKTEPSPDRDLLLAVQQAALHAAELTRDLVGFSQLTSPRWQPTGLRAYLDTATMPSTETAPGPSVEAPPSPPLEARSGLTKAEAEELLDLLEAKGLQGRELAYVEGEGFTVRWQGDALPARSARQCRRSRRDPCPECGSTRP